MDGQHPHPSPASLLVPGPTERQSISAIVMPCEKAKNAFPLLKLPAELRLLVYQYVFFPEGETPVEIIVDRRWNNHPTPPHASALTFIRYPHHQLPISLVQACKATYQETVPFLYAHKTFTCLANRVALGQFLNYLSGTARQSIRSFRLRWDAGMADTIARSIWRKNCAQIASLGPSVQEVGIEMFCIGTPRRSNRVLEIFLDDKTWVKSLCQIPARKVAVGWGTWSPLCLDALQKVLDAYVEREEERMAHESERPQKKRRLKADHSKHSLQHLAPKRSNEN